MKKEPRNTRNGLFRVFPDFFVVDQTLTRRQVPSVEAAVKIARVLGEEHQAKSPHPNTGRKKIGGFNPPKINSIFIEEKAVVHHNKI